MLRALIFLPESKSIGLPFSLELADIESAHFWPKSKVIGFPLLLKLVDFESLKAAGHLFH